MQERFFKNLVLVVLINLLVKPFYIFGIDRSVQNILGPSGYGMFFSLFMFTQIFSILLDPGISQFNNREISRNQHILGRYFTNLAILKLLLGLVYFIFMLVLALALRYNSMQVKVLLVLLFNQFLLSFISFLRSNISGLQLYVPDSLLSATDRLILIAITSVLIWGGTSVPLTPVSYALAMTLSYFLTALLALGVIIRFAGRLQWQFQWKSTLILLRQVKPYALLIFLMAAYKSFDSFALERLLGGEDGKFQAGIYAQSFRVMDAFNQFALLFAGLLLPMFARLIRLGQPVTRLLKLSVMLLAIPAVLLAIGGIFYRADIIPLLYHSDEAGSSAIFGWLMVSFLGVCITYTFGTLLTANGSLTQLNRMAMAALILNVALNLWLIPAHKALGSAWANAATQGFMAVVQIYLVWRTFGSVFTRPEILRIVSFVLTIVGLALIVPYFASGLIGFMTLMSTGVLAAIVWRVFNPLALLEIVRQNKA